MLVWVYGGKLYLKRQFQCQNMIKWELLAVFLYNSFIIASKITIEECFIHPFCSKFLLYHG